MRTFWTEKKAALGRWAVIDLETTGVDPINDQIIDVGFLVFEGTKIVKKYSSLVRYPYELSYFIQKLTGITTSMANRAPKWEEVESEIQEELMGAKLLAHNADFEEGFLKKSFDQIALELKPGEPREKFYDSILFLGMLFPEYSSLKLEHFIFEWGIRENEIHRGLEDSIDLLKVMLLAASLVQMDHDLAFFIKKELELKISLLEEYWPFHFLYLSKDELQEIAGQIDFNLEEQTKVVFEKISTRRLPRNSINSSEKKMQEKWPKHFSFEFSGENIRQIFGDEEKIKKHFPHYQIRKAQIDLALKAGQSLKNNIHSLIQAPTGTGKTFGYLIPSVLYTLNEKKPVLVATGTKALQRQAYEKDIPKVREFLGLSEDEYKIKLLVGSQNHWCESLFRQKESEEGNLLLTEDFSLAFTLMYFNMIFFFNGRLKGDLKLLREDMPFVLKRKIVGLEVWANEAAVDFRSCTGNLCPYKHECSYLQGLREAREANMIIGNHALMFSWPQGLPRPEAIIVDEAHKIEEEATRAFSLEIEQKSFDVFVNSLGHLQGIGSLFYLLSQNEESEGESTQVIKSLREETLVTHQRLLDHLPGLEPKFSLYFKKLPKYTESYWNELPFVDRHTHRDPMALDILNTLESLAFILDSYLKILIPYSSRFDVKEMKNENELTAYTRFETFFSTLSDYVSSFEKLLTPVAGLSRSMKYLEGEGYVLSLGPIDVGTQVYEKLLATSQSVIFTSATLANGKGDTGERGIEWATGYVHVPPEKRFKAGTYLPYTFDYQKNTKVYLCDDAPSLNDPNFVRETLNKVIPLIYKLGGRTLFLFSAKTRFEVAREILLKEFENKIPLFVQGMGSHVVDDFRKSPAGILLGMETFGEGIDVPGDSLQFIFIDKIPDLRMDLVIKERRDFFEANLGNEFTDYYLSHRTRALHQKLGRLLRTENDYGGVMIIDNRVKGWKGKTMEKLIKLMAPYELLRAPMDQAVAEIEDFILCRSNHLNI